jgi:hypothetical protein
VNSFENNNIKCIEMESSAWFWNLQRHCVAQDLQLGCGQMHGVLWMLSASATNLESIISCLNGNGFMHLIGSLQPYSTVTVRI